MHLRDTLHAPGTAMIPQDEPQTLDAAMRGRVLERLGLRAAPATDLDGLRTLYRAWCACVPFDNVRKMIALRRGDAALPGGHADDFFAHWLSDGTGGTCWPTSNALHRLATALGFVVERVAGSMRDSGHVNHGSVRAHVDGQRWLIDSSLLFEAPLPLDRGVYVGPDPVFAVEIEPVDDGNHLIWADVPPNPEYLPCRLFAGTVTHAFCLERYEASRERSAFNERLYARRNRPGELLVLVGDTRYSKTASGLAVRALSRDELLVALRDEIGISGRMIDAWVDSGSLDDSLRPPSGPKPPPVAGLPPSRRAPPS